MPSGLIQLAHKSRTREKSKIQKKAREFISEKLRRKGKENVVEERDTITRMTKSDIKFMPRHSRIFNLKTFRSHAEYITI